MKQMLGKMKSQLTQQNSFTLNFHAATFRDVLRHNIDNEPPFLVHLSSVKVNIETLCRGEGGGGRGSESKGIKDKISLPQQRSAFSVETNQQFCRRLWLYFFLRFILHYR